MRCASLPCAPARCGPKRRIRQNSHDAALHSHDAAPHSHDAPPHSHDADPAIRVTHSARAAVPHAHLSAFAPIFAQRRAPSPNRTRSAPCEPVWSAPSTSPKPCARAPRTAVPAVVRAPIADGAKPATAKLCAPTSARSCVQPTSSRQRTTPPAQLPKSNQLPRRPHPQYQTVCCPPHPHRRTLGFATFLRRARARQSRRSPRTTTQALPSASWRLLESQRQA